MFKEKNEARLSGTFSTMAELNTADGIQGGGLQAAFAPTKRLGLIANASFFGKEGDGKGRLYELGAGYYKPIQTKRSGAPGNIVFEVYGVAGWGKASNSECGSCIKVNMLKGYAQPSIGFANKRVEAFFSAKIGAVHLYNLRENFSNRVYPCFGDPEEYYPYTTQDALDDLHVLQNSQTAFLLEPAFTSRFGGRYVKIHVQFGWSFLTSHFEEVSGRFNFNTGLLISFAPRYLKRNQKKEGLEN